MARIWIHNGTDLPAMAYGLMEAAGVRDKLRPEMRCCIKPNLVVARPASEGATTHPGIVEGIIQYLQDAGCRDITIAEGAWVGDSTRRAWDACGYTALKQKYGVGLVDTKADRAIQRKSAGISLSLCETPLNADFLINVPVLKGHCQTGLTCCLKNLKGCIPDAEKRRFHTMGLHKPIAALSAALRPDLHIVDSICGDLSFEEGGNPVQQNRLLLAYDPVLMDSYCAQLIGYQPDEIAHLRLARDLGVGRYADEQTEVIDLNPGSRPMQQAMGGRAASRYAPYIAEDSACSACYAALVYALHHSGVKPSESIYIGQGYKGRQVEGVGVGNCTSGCGKSLPGCPPKAADIVAFLEGL